MAESEAGGEDTLLASLARKIIAEGDYVSVDGLWMRIDSAYDVSEEEAALIRRIRTAARESDPDE